MQQGNGQITQLVFTENEISALRGYVTKLDKKGAENLEGKTLQNTDQHFSSEKEIQSVIATLDQYCKDQKIENEHAVEKAVTKFIAKYEKTLATSTR